MKRAFTIIAAPVAVYLLGAFVIADPDIRNWHVGERFLVAFWAFFAAIFAWVEA